LSKAHKARNSLAVPVRRLSWFLSLQFTLEICMRHSHKMQKNTKPLIFKVQGHSRSSMLTPLKACHYCLIW